MAQPALRQEDLKALDQTRQRLIQLTSNIASLKADFQKGAPLPEYSSVMTSSSILTTNIKSMTDHLSAHGDTLSRIVAFPSTNFPGRTQEGLLLQLLRKKLEPQVETWVDEGRNLQIDGLAEEGKDGNLEETWKWAAEWIGPRIREYALNEAGDEYTAEERESGVENVNTGLRDEEESDEDDEDTEDGDQVMGGTSQSQEKKKAPEKVLTRKDGRIRSKDEILRFATSGIAI
ncbi:mediator of RNA polymerase II transcription subunit 8 [Clarireedia jacksonii]